MWLCGLGQRAPAHRSLRVVVAPFLADLAHVTQETVLLVVPGRGAMLFTEEYVGSGGSRPRRHAARRPRSPALRGFGRGDPRVRPEPWLRAELAEIRRRGYAVSHVEPAPGWPRVSYAGMRRRPRFVRAVDLRRRRLRESRRIGTRRRSRC